MEPVEGKVVYTHTTIITDAGPGYNMLTGAVVNHYINVFGAKLWLGQPCTLSPGDRVRITITKEPSDAQ